MENRLQHAWRRVGGQVGTYGSREKVEARSEDSRLWGQNCVVTKEVDEQDRRVEWMMGDGYGNGSRGHGLPKDKAQNATGF